MLVISNTIACRVAILIVMVSLAACDTTVTKNPPDVPSWEGEAPGLIGVDEAPEFRVNVLVEVTERSEGGTLGARGQKVRLPNQRIVKTGNWQMYYEDGTLRAEGPYRDDLRDGPWVYFADNGNKESEGEYAAGKRVGPWTYYTQESPPQIEHIDIFGEREALIHRTRYFKFPLNVPAVEAEMHDQHEAGTVVRYDHDGVCWVIEERDREGDLLEWMMYLPDGTPFAFFRDGHYQVQGFTRRRLAQRDAFGDAKNRLQNFGGQRRELD